MFPLLAYLIKQKLVKIESGGGGGGGVRHILFCID